MIITFCDETIFRSKCGWHQLMKCHGGDERDHQSDKHDIRDKPSDNQDEAVFQPAVLFFFSPFMRAVIEGPGPDC